LAMTMPAGEISVVDPGGFGAVTLTQSVTINGDGTLASIVASGTNAITVNGASTGAAKGSAVGYHLGGDFTYFVHRAVGIAGGIRYGRATVAVNSEPLSNLKQEFLVGGTTVFLGLRFRFGPNHE